MEGIDLHTHSNISDGTLSPEQLVLAAVEKNIHTLALTDHDTMDGLILAEKAAEKQQIKIISGVEISSQWSRPATKKSYGVHIVALNMKNPEPLQRVLIEQKKVRAARSKQICDLLIPLIHESGGFAVLAHPTKYDLSATNIRYLIEIFAQYGGDAVELPPAIEPASTRQMIDRKIAEHELKVSVGSDFHGDHMPWIRLGNIPRLKEGQIGIWESFNH